MRRLLKTVLTLLITLSCLLPATLPADTTTPVVVKLTLHDTIQPITADYLQRGLQEADDQIGVADPDAINADERHLPAWCVVQVRFKDGFVVDAKEAQISFKLCRKWRKTWYKPHHFRI